MSVERKQIVHALHRQRDVVVHTAQDDSNAILERLTQEARNLYSALRIQFNAEKYEPHMRPGSAQRGFQESLAFQRIKQDVMRDLKHTIQSLRENPEISVETSANGRRVFMDADEVLWTEREGRRERLTAGDILIDGDWGIDYNLDGSVPIAIRKRYMLECAKRRLRDLLDVQLNKFGVRSGARLRMRAILARHDTVREGNLNSSEIGIVAEHIARGFLTRAAYSLFGKRHLFHIIPTDEFSESLEKIDFIIQKNDASFARGAEVHADKKLSAIGVQFTIVKNPKKEIKKESVIQVAKRRGLVHVDDIVLLRLPGAWAADAYDKWLEAGKPRGGPERFLAPEQKRAIFRGALQRLLSDEDIEEGLRLLETPVE